MKQLLLLLTLLILTNPATARPWHYNLLDDLEKTGDVVKANDDSDMQMTFDVTYPYWMVRYQLRRVLEDSRVGFESETGDARQAFVGSRWFINSVDGAANFFSGIDQVRVKFDGRVVNVGPGQTRLILAGRLQVQKSNNNRGWVDKSEREIRNSVREIAASTFLRCRYPTELALRQSVAEDYKTLGKHLGKDNYELPPRQNLSQAEAAEHLKFSWCAHQDCLEMPEASSKFCLDHKPEAQPIVVESPSSVADEIRKLKQLLDDGLINQEQFETQKAKLLGE